MASDEPPQTPRFKQRSNWNPVKWFGQGMDRLRTEVINLHRRISERTALDLDPFARTHCQRANEMLALTIDAMNIGDTAQAWLHFKVARRSFMGTYSHEEIELEAARIGEQCADALNGWKAAVVSKYITEITNQSKDLDTNRTRLILAIETLDRHYDGLHEGKDRIRKRLWLLLTSGVTILIFSAILYVLIRRCDPIAFDFMTTDGPPPLSLYGIFAMSVAGSLGALLSAILDFTSRGKVPSEFDSALVTFSRPFVGMVCGTVALFLAHSGIIGTLNTTSLVWMTAFAFGFSERFFLGTMKKLEK